MVVLNAKHRAAWKKIRLENAEKLNLLSWKKFCVNFELHRNRVENWNDDEERDLLMRNLPNAWRVKVVQEKNRRKRNQFWVFFYGPCESASALQQNLQDFLELEVGEIKMGLEGILVCCNSEEDRKLLIELNGE